MTYTLTLDLILRKALLLNGELMNILPQRALDSGNEPVFKDTKLDVSTLTPWIDPSPGLLNLESELHSDLVAKYDKENREPIDVLKVKISYPEGLLEFGLFGEGVSQMLPLLIAGYGGSSRTECHYGVLVPVAIGERKGIMSIGNSISDMVEYLLADAPSLTGRKGVKDAKAMKEYILKEGESLKDSVTNIEDYFIGKGNNPAEKKEARRLRDLFEKIAGQVRSYSVHTNVMDENRTGWFFEGMSGAQKPGREITNASFSIANISDIDGMVNLELYHTNPSGDLQKGVCAVVPQVPGDVLSITYSNMGLTIKYITNIEKMGKHVTLTMR